MISSLILVGSLLALTYAKPHGLRAEMVLHEYITTIPAGFVDGGPANPESLLDLQIALVQGGMDDLIETLHNVSSPGHPSFGQYLSQEDVIKLTSPAQETIVAVTAWLHDAGLNATAMTLAGDWIQLNATVSLANELFDADFSVFIDTATGAQSIRTLNYSIPADLVGHLDFVHPTISFSSSDPSQVTTSSSADRGNILRTNTTILARANHGSLNPETCNAKVVTPKCVQRLHGIPATMVSGQHTGTLGVVGMNDQYANLEDLKSFLEYYRPDITAPHAKTFNVVSVNGGQNPQDINQAGDEANVDTQYTVGIATGVPTTFYTVGTEAPKTNGFQALLNYFKAQPNDRLPGVLTFSYAAGNEPAVSAKTLNRLCNGFAALTVRGVSVIVATMDGGVGGADPKNINDCPEGKFIPVFPATCPYVTAVGSTTMQPLPDGALSQVAAGLSGGGFSNHFADQMQFRFQEAAVRPYLKQLDRLHPEYAGKFNPSGRAYPDVSTVGNFVVFDSQDKAKRGAGTSISAPIFASMIALINAERLAAGKTVLGWLNGFLYANPGAFVDIVSGSNPGCNTDGFPATPGWDPVTGLGTPIFDRLKAAGLAWQ
ncbi:hypothetical protein NM688_g5505 [Phlebia brevispora]|uniref:Uncharacterized protein n=1 Tax=Phlebia brevispora TaxID=194682 RepID=A0ACC1SU52_9APHY|nr:hypothetical protein NM688_g5505 [Phlebia brevispora]